MTLSGNVSVNGKQWVSVWVAASLVNAWAKVWLGRKTEAVERLPMFASCRATEMHRH